MSGKKHEHDESLWKYTEQSEARKKLGYISQQKGNLLQFTIKYLIFREIWKLPCVV